LKNPCSEFAGLYLREIISPGFFANQHRNMIYSLSLSKKYQKKKYAENDKKILARFLIVFWYTW